MVVYFVLILSTIRVAYFRLNPKYGFEECYEIDLGIEQRGINQLIIFQLVAGGRL